MQAPSRLAPPFGRLGLSREFLCLGMDEHSAVCWAEIAHGYAPYRSLARMVAEKRTGVYLDRSTA